MHNTGLVLLNGLHFPCDNLLWTYFQIIKQTKALLLLAWSSITWMAIIHLADPLWLSWSCPHLSGLLLERTMQFGWKVACRAHMTSCLALPLGSPLRLAFWNIKFENIKFEKVLFIPNSRKEEAPFPRGQGISARYSVVRISQREKAVWLLKTKHGRCCMGGNLNMVLLGLMSGRQIDQEQDRQASGSWKGMHLSPPDRIY